MKLKKQLTNNLHFALAVLLLVIIVILRISDIYINDILLGIALILVAATLTYSSFKESNRLRDKKNIISYLPIYAAGVLSGFWIYEAIELLF